MSERTTIGKEIVARANSLDEIATYIDDLRAKNYELTVKLSEFQNGLPIEKADKERTYFFVSPAGLIWRVIWSEPDQQWLTRSTHNSEYEALRVNRVYPLPSTETQMEGE